MADTTENILISLKLDLPTSAAQIDKLAASVAALKKATDQFNGSSAEGAAAQDEDTKAKERSEVASKKLKETIEAEAGSIKSIRDENKKLTQERNNTSLATEEGRKKVQELNEHLDKNNKTIKENVDSYTAQKINIGNYKSALDGLVPGLGGVIDGIGGMTKAGLAFIATPLGMILGALGLALGSLIAYFKSSEEGQNRLNRIMIIGGAVMEQLKNFAEAVGEALYNAFTNPKQAMQDLYEFVKQNLINRFTAFKVILEGIMDLDFHKIADGVIQAGTGVENALEKVKAFSEEVSKAVAEGVKNGNLLADMQERIDKTERAMLVDRARVNLEVAKLREKAIKEEGEQKRKTIEEAIALEKGLADREVALANQRLAQAQLELKNNGDDKAAKEKVAKATVDVINAEAQRYEATLRFEKQYEALRLKEDADKARLSAADVARDKKAEEEKIKNHEKAEAKIASDKAIKDAKILKDEQAAATAKQKIDAATFSFMQKNSDKYLGTHKVNLKAAAELTKKGALSSLAADTNVAALKAYKSAADTPLIGWLLGPVAYAATYAAGLASLAEIAGLALPFATGGSTRLSGTRISGNMGTPITRNNGDNLLATVATGEVILNRSQQERLGGDSTFRAIGVPGFASGGYTGHVEPIISQSTLNGHQDNSMLQELQGIHTAVRQTRPVLVLQDFEYIQGTHNSIKTQATMI